MANLTLEERVAALEAKVAHIKDNGADKISEPPRGWQRLVGLFQNAPGFEEGARLGREWREAQQDVEDEGFS